MYLLFFARQASTRLVCALFSLPVPPESPSRSKEDPTTFSSKSVPAYMEKESVQKILLFGVEGSGTSTIFKQVSPLVSRSVSTNVACIISKIKII